MSATGSLTALNHVIIGFCFAIIAGWHGRNPITFERTKDAQLIKRICTHAKIFPSSSDDLSASPAEWQPVEHDAIWYVLVKDNATLLGLFALFPQNSICWEVHVCLLPSCYGKTSEAMQAMFRWVFAGSQCLRIVGSVPVFNTLAIRLAERSGMKRYGMNTKSRLHKGVLYDQILFGISRSEVCPYSAQSSKA